MRLAVLVVVALVAGCQPAGSTNLEYRVLSHEGEIASATLMLCDQIYELSREDSVWTVHAPAACEGGGLILVQLADGASVSCSGDRVTPGMRDETFGYIASSTGCAFTQ